MKHDRRTGNHLIVFSEYKHLQPLRMKILLLRLQWVGEIAVLESKFFTG